MWFNDWFPSQTNEQYICMYLELMCSAFAASTDGIVYIKLPFWISCLFAEFQEN